MTPEQKLTKAKSLLIMSEPFFGSLVLRLPLEEDTKTKTMVTNGKSIRYNPKVINDASVQEVQGMLAHTVMHPALLHHTRRNGRDADKWNKACDYVVDSILNKSGFYLPNTQYINHNYADMSAEGIYEILPDEPKGDNSGNSNSDGNGSGNNDGNGDVEDSPESQDSGGSTSQAAAEESEWKQNMAQAVHAAKQAGKLPAHLQRMFEELIESKIPWRETLKRFMTEKSPDDFSWRRGNRRFLANGLYLPSRISDDALGEMVVVIDTSGSIGQKELDLFGGEITAIHSEVKPSKLHVIYCDSNINNIDTFGPEDELTFTLYGGGGTDFRPPFDWVRENSIAPKAMAYLTDGYGPFPEEQDFPVMWCINNEDVVPPFGEHLLILD